MTGDPQARRKYQATLDFIHSGFLACSRNATDLVMASQTLLGANLHAPALSLAVLALEELGKLCAIDGLLFARAGDEKPIFLRKPNEATN